MSVMIRWAVAAVLLCAPAAISRPAVAGSHDKGVGAAASECAKLQDPKMKDECVRAANQARKSQGDAAKAKDKAQSGSADKAKAAVKDKAEEKVKEKAKEKAKDKAMDKLKEKAKSN